MSSETLIFRHVLWKIYEAENIAFKMLLII